MTAGIESAMSGLLAHVTAKAKSFETTGRRVIHWSQVTAQPALFLRRTGMTDHYTGNMKTVTIEGEFWVYCNAGADATATPDETLTDLEEEVRAALAPDDQNRFTIGGLAYWCRIEGKSDISPGDQGPQAIARIPVRITLP